MRSPVAAVALAGLCAAVLSACFFGDPSDSLAFTVENRTGETLRLWEYGDASRGTVDPGDETGVSLGATSDDCTANVSARTLDDRLEARAPEICHGDTWVIEPEDLRSTRAED